MADLRFAPIIRVSTEKQEDQGESLRTQKTQIIQSVKQMGGEIPECCWKYSGQEHATPGYERTLLDQLLADSSKGIFNAVIVCDITRWSRDNAKSKKGLAILKANGIRFFIGTWEQNLHKPENLLFLGVSAEMGEYFAKSFNQKSMDNRIHKAKRGFPVSGKLPYGRTFDKKTEQWGIDKEKAETIRWAAGKYLAGDPIAEIAKAIGMRSYSNLWKILTRCSDDIWIQHFDSEEFNIHEEVPTPVPPLLSKDVIGEIHSRSQSNKTYTHGVIKHQYLLSRVIFCGKCGYAMFGQMNRRRDRRYYRHNHQQLKRPCDVKNRWMKADLIEDVVIRQLFGMFGNKKQIEEAASRAIPDLERIERLRSEKERLEKQLAKNEAQKDRIVKSIMEDIITKAEAAKIMEELRTKKEVIRENIDRILSELDGIPSVQEIKSTVRRINPILVRLRNRQSMLKHPDAFHRMSYEDKRALIEAAFAGKDLTGQRYGVYLYPDLENKKKWKYEIRGSFGNIVRALPASTSERNAMLEDVIPPLDGDVTSFSNPRSTGSLP